MSELERLDVDSVVEMNADLCAESHENSALLDGEGLAAALERPWTGFGDFEAFPTMYEKAAALLHGIASRQVFENGNKRTAWVAAVTLLELNDIDIGQVETVQSDMFVRAAGLDHSLTVKDIAEWFQVASERRRAGCATDPRFEYLVLARDVGFPNPSTISIQDGHLAGVTVDGDLPILHFLHLATRIHWRRSDLGRAALLEVFVEEDTRTLVPIREGSMPPRPADRWRATVDPPAIGGHDYHPDGIMPTMVGLAMAMTIIRPGRVWLRVELDGIEVGRIPFSVDVIPQPDPDHWLATIQQRGGPTTERPSSRSGRPGPGQS